MEADLKIALRDSKTATRPYVILNPMLAKHLPATPSETLEYFSRLGERTAASCQGERVLVIGFAETATAVGAAVASRIAGAVYVHTTREAYSQSRLVSEFFEEHSHARNQALYLREELTDKSADLSAYDRVVFVEDEITTGKTIRNFLQSAGRGGKITVSALVFNSFDETAFSQYDQYDANFFCLQKINGIDESLIKRDSKGPKALWRVFPKGTVPASDRVACGPLLRETYGSHAGRSPDGVNYLGFQCRLNPRLGVDIAEYRAECLTLASQIAASLDSAHINEKNLLVMGTEEFMYPALVLGSELEKSAKSVKSHSTTRSPLLPLDESDYPLRSRHCFSSPYDSARVTYLYNLEQYDTVIVMTDAPGSGHEELLRVIGGLGGQVYFVKISYAGAD